MGLFFNFDRPGPGIEKDAPKNKGIRLFFELLGRNIGKLFLSNILYFIVSLPVLIVYFIVVSYFLDVLMPEAVGTVSLSQLSIIVTLLLVILWGSGPISCGYTYILRNAVREEHTYLFSDFFEKSKEGFRHGLVFLLVDVVMLLSSTVAIWTYRGMSEQSGGIFMLPLGLVFLTLIVYTIMHFYMYQFEVTFENSILQVYKNSLMMALATAPMCILIGLVICLISTVLLGFFIPMVVVILALLCWMSLMRFAVDFYTTRVIKRELIDKKENNE